jgi:hypothetical protein
MDPRARLYFLGGDPYKAPKWKPRDRKKGIIMAYKKTPKKKPVESFLAHHKRNCNFYIFSGSRSCSCGRDVLAAELIRLREIEEKYKQISRSSLL